MIQKVEAVVLRSMNYQESSKILTIYTRQSGAMGVLVKGARRTKNKFGASLDQLAHINAIVYVKESRELQLLTDAELISSFPKTQQNFDKLFISLSVIELLYLLSRHTEQNEPLYDLLLEVIYAIERATNSVITLFYYFEAHVVRLLGFQPSLERCSECNRSSRELAESGVANVLFEYQRGSYLCESCMPHSDDRLLTDLRAVMMWEHLGRADVKNIMGLTVPEAIQGDLDTMLTRYLEYHQPEIRQLRAKKLFDSMR
jgi:DNA repair protein RecO (recombination protein O)